mmetsp:Transcript_39119/g.125651  ORF Transcript_39119/g.125651 Transcript_39119/m.125651 type:complete len:201 (-) Transcript_39119:134-736(-)
MHPVHRRARRRQRLDCAAAASDRPVRASGRAGRGGAGQQERHLGLLPGAGPHRRGGAGGRLRKGARRPARLHAGEPRPLLGRRLARPRRLRAAAVCVPAVRARALPRVCGARLGRGGRVGEVPGVAQPRDQPAVRRAHPAREGAVPETCREVCGGQGEEQGRERCAEGRGGARLRRHPRRRRGPRAGRQVNWHGVAPAHL